LEDNNAGGDEGRTFLHRKEQEQKQEENWAWLVRERTAGRLREVRVLDLESLGQNTENAHDLKVLVIQNHIQLS
jgi:hypothetical protein